MEFLSYYHFNEEPFSVIPATKFYFHNLEHDRALMQMQRAVNEMKGLALLVGEVGTGKTLLARHLLEDLPEDKFDISMLVVLQGTVTCDWLIRRIAAQFGVEGELTKPQIIERLYKRLVELHEAGKKAVIIIDEAQMLREKELLEELRGLLNLELANSKLLTFILVGMPDLDDVIKMEPALAGRVAVRSKLHPFTRQIMEDYVKYRLLHTGAGQMLFAEDALDAIFKYSKGNPRLVNVMCDNALFEGFIRKSALPLQSSIIDGVASDLGL